eukprot:gene6333-1129_t
MAFALLAAPAAAASPFAAPSNLLVEYLPSPVVGMDDPSPRFSWSLASSARGVVCDAWQVFDSGKVASPSTVGVSFPGLDLRPVTRYTWQVRWWGNASVAPDPSDYAEPALLETGLMGPQGGASALWYDAQLMSAAGGGTSLQGRFIHANDSRCCPVQGYPCGCVWWERYSDRTKHFLTNCDQVQAQPDPLCTYRVALLPFLLSTRLPLTPPTAPSSRSGLCLSHHQHAANQPNQAHRTSPICRAAPGTPGHGGAWERQLEPVTSTHLESLGFQQFSVPAGVVVARARAYVAGYGWISATVNGKKAGGDRVLEAGRTQFTRRMYYSTYQIEDSVVPGKNAIGLALGGGWAEKWGLKIAAKAVVMVWLDGNDNPMVFSGAALGWKAATGGVVSAGLYEGEVFDARREPPHWDTPAFDASSWPAPRLGDPNGLSGYAVAWQPLQPIRAFDPPAPPLSVSPVVVVGNETVYVFDYGQNAAGWLVLTLPQGCPAGTVVTLYFSEVLCGRGTNRWSTPCDKSTPGGGVPGTVDPRNYRSPERDQYVCKGGAQAETWEPRFTYHGFRFAQVHGYPLRPMGPTDLVQRRVHSDVASPSEGFIELGAGPTDPKAGLLDGVAHMVKWVNYDNLLSVPSDCDQRNERMGWMADASVASEAAILAEHMPAFYTNWLTLMRDVQTDPAVECNPDRAGKEVGDCEGAVTDWVPSPGGKKPGDPSWMFAYPLLYDEVHRYYADTRLAQALWPGVSAYTDFMQGLVTYVRYGDWLQPGKASILMTQVSSTNLISQMSAAFNHVQTLRIACDSATSLGNSTAAAMYCSYLNISRAGYHKLFYNPATGTYGDGTQAATVYPLYAEAVPDDLVAQTVGHLVGLITNGPKLCDSTPCLDTGILSTKWVMETLSRHGHSGLGLQLLLKEDYPSWGYMLRMNATTIWEHWEYMNGGGMNSHAHPALGSVGAWMYRWLAGIRLGGEMHPENYGKGFQYVTFAPAVVDHPSLASAQATVYTIWGDVRISWSFSGGQLHMNTSLPANTFGEVYPPDVTGCTLESVREGSTPIWKDGDFTPESYAVGTPVSVNPYVPGAIAIIGGCYKFSIGYECTPHSM